MRHETFQSLVENIRRDGKLTSVPFAALDPATGKYEVLSGNHRVSGSIQAGLTAIDVMVTDDPLPKAQRIAIQLSHNALEGEDDPATLKLLYESIEAIDWQLYSGLDDKSLELLAKVETTSLSEANLSFDLVSIVFLPEDRARATEAWKAAQSMVDADEIWLARASAYDPLMDALDLASRSYSVRNVATSLELVLSTFLAHQEDLAAGWVDPLTGDPLRSGWVPLATILGMDAVPAEAGAIIRKAVHKMRDRGEITGEALWRSLELWAADYLAGPD